MNALQRLIFAALAFCALPPAALPQPAGTTPLPDSPVNSVIMRCRQCGVINAVREVQQARGGATASLGSDAPVGLVLFIPVGPGSKQGDGYAGSVGTREWQNRIATTAYEYTVRMDDGEFKVVSREGLSDLQVGDRVRVDGGRIERFGS